MSKPVNFSKNPIALHAITANHVNDNFRFQLSIKAYDHAGAELASASLKGVPDANGEFVFNAKTFLHAILKPDLPFVNQNQILPGTASFLNWTADLSEYWGTPTASLKSTSRLADNLVLMAGLSFHSFPGNDFIAEHVARDRKFLTWQPDFKLVSPDQQEYLYYLNVEQNMPTVYRQVKAYYTDGTSTSFPAISLANATDKLLIVPAGLQQIGLQTLPKKVSSYQVWLSSDSAGYSNKSEVRTYLVDHNYYKSVRYFLYQNSLGGFNTLRTTGEIEEGLEVDVQEAETVLGDEYSAADSQFFEYGENYQDAVKANTGFIISKAEMQHLKEFLTSKYRYEIVNGRFVRIILNTNRFKLGKSFSHEHSIDFEYRYAHRETAFA